MISPLIVPAILLFALTARQTGGALLRGDWLYALPWLIGGAGQFSIILHLAETHA